MPALKIPFSESARLEALHRYHIIDTPPEEAFDRVAKLASTFFKVSLAFISFIDKDTQWFKACHGAELVKAPRDTSFCTHTIASDDVLVVPDACQDKRFCSAPFVKGAPGARFYAGAPLKTPDGHAVGTVFIVDIVARRRLSAEQCGVLESLAATVMDTLEARRQAHLAAQQERQLHNIIQSSSDLIYIKDLQGRYTFFNRPPLGDDGPQVADIVGKTDWEIFPESAEQFTSFDRYVLDTQQAIKREETLHLDGRTIVNHSNKKPFFSPQGELMGILGISRDVTAEAGVRLELERSLTLLQATLEATTEGILSVDTERNILLTNQRYETMRSVPESILADRDDRELIDYVKNQHKDPGAWLQSTEDIYNHPEKASHDLAEMVDGSVFERSSYPMYSGDEVIGRVWSFRNVTEQRRTQAALFESEAKLRAIIEASSDAIYTRDLAGRYTFINRAGALLLGYEPAELIGKTNFDLLPKVEAEQITHSDQTVLSENRRVTRTTTLTVQGEKRTFTVEKLPLRGANGSPSGIVGITRDITESVRNRRELERSLSLLKTTFDAIGKGILNVGLDGTIHSFNQTYLDMWQVPGEIIALCDDNALITHARRQYVDPVTYLDSLEEQLKDPEATLKDVGALKDGRLIERTLTPQRLDGEVIGRVWTFRDVTNEMSTEQALRDSEEKFRELAENIDDMFWLASPDLEETQYVSPAYEKIWGRSIEAAYNDAKDYLDAIHHEDKRRVIGAMERMLEGNYDETYRIIHPDGGVRWVRDRAFPIYNDNGTVKRYAGVTQDISERVSFEQRLEESEKRTRSILESITDAFFSLDRKWRFTYINEQACVHLRHAQKDLLNKTIWEALPDIENSAFYTRCHVAVSSGKAALFEEYFPQIGTWFEIHIYPSAEGLSVYFHDINERKHQQETLRQAKDDAEQANRAKSEFLSRMSHELRTPLNAILGFGQLLRLGDLSEEDSEAAKDIVQAGEHLLGLIDEVLDIARIESGHMEVSLEPLCLAEILDEALVMLRPLAQQARLNVRAVVPPEVCVKADWQRLKQVLINLLSNAIKYNVEGGEVIIESGRSGDKNFIYIRDTGVGIAPELLPRVFDPFDRLGAETTSVEGTGIGLSLTKHLVELMGGAIGVESTLGEGSTFRLEFESATPLLQVEPAATAQLVLPGMMRDYKVIYIEDNLTNLKLVERIFADMTRVELLSTVQGRIGIELAVQHVPDLILLDLHLPDMPGREVLRQLRAGLATKDIPVLIISADALPERRRELEEDGVNAYLTKPLNLDDFTHKVRSLLELP